MLKEILSLMKGFFSRLVGRLIFTAFVAAGFTLFYKYREGRRKQSQLYVRGVITDRYDRPPGYGHNSGAYFQYRFEVNGKTYVNSALRSLCSGCKHISCVVGDSLLIEYRIGNPNNNAPVCNK